MNAPAQTFWRGRRVMVTGHTGFKGGWLSLWLHHLGAAVAGYALPPPTVPGVFDLCGIGQLVRHTEGDVRDLPTLTRAIDSFRPDIIFHLAAQPLVRASYNDPVGTWTTNVMGTVNVLEAARRVPGIAAVVIVTTDKCYAEDPERLPYRETDRLGGRDPYSGSKAAAEIATAAYARSFLIAGGCATASVRAGNVIGGGDWAEDRLAADIMRALLAGQTPVLRNPEAIRPWQHVLDPLCGYLFAAEHLVRERPGEPEAWNFGPEAASEISVRRVAEILCDCWGHGATFRVELQTGAPHEAPVLRLDSSKARQGLGWTPRLSLRTALEMTADWFRAYAAGNDMAAFSRHQIDAYSTKLEAEQ
jgi:CDP-glucose 4,6-dehydratase